MPTNDFHFIMPATVGIKVLACMIWSFKSFQWSELGNIFSTLWSQPKLLPINLGGKFCMRHMIGLDVRKIS